MKNEIIYDIVNDLIFKELEKGNIPWKRPWKTNFPINMLSKKEYSGFNWWLLMLTQEEKKYKSNIWATFNQISNAGGKIKKGQHAVPIIYWTMLKFVSDKINKKTGEKSIETRPLLRYYKVFNLDQTQDIKVKDIKITPQINYTADSILEKYWKEVPTVYEGSRAYYSVTKDTITIPPKHNFFSGAEFYATNFHEMIHSTGHKKRLNRFKEDNNIESSFGSESYSKEELTAEMGSAYLCAKSKILPNIVKNSAAYIQHWLKALKDDKTLLISASGKAQKAVEFILK